MANGTIALDTLQTSGQIESRTTGLSLDTDYVVNGSAKTWINFNGTGTIAIRDSFNISTITDVGTGEYTVTINNGMANANHVVTTGMTSYNGEGDTRFVAMLRSAGDNDWSNYTTTSFKTMCKQVANGGSGTDHSLLLYSVDGELA